MKAADLRVSEEIWPSSSPLVTSHNPFAGWGGLAPWVDTGKLGVNARDEESDGGSTARSVLDRRGPRRRVRPGQLATNPPNPRGQVPASQRLEDHDLRMRCHPARGPRAGGRQGRTGSCSSRTATKRWEHSHAHRRMTRSIAVDQLEQQDQEGSSYCMVIRRFGVPGGELRLRHPNVNRRPPQLVLRRHPSRA